ncbi:hypothetical protein [Gulosibacter sediminis]|uniref:hypothetical protein n=1 Tax=Gulosibacter sediminis TaxID=1729695 RepID=UPI0024A90958|nr:hypothetical protein [Gulosibacter sediminis]
MSESTTLREAIARAARGALDAYYAQPNDGIQKAEEDVITDAVLAVLADLPAGMLDRATAALVEWDGVDAAVASGTVTQDGYRNGARRALEAAFGGEQA